MSTVAGTIEHHPENGIAPWVVRIVADNGMDLSLGYRTEAQARDRMPALVAMWRNALDTARMVGVFV